MKSCLLSVSVLAMFCLVPLASHAATYYVANDGSDAAPGASPQTPWQTIAKVNATKLAPGDVILLRRGDRWRESLDPQSGSEGRPITYSAYGSGDKPLLLGSVNRSKPGDWRHEGGNIWVTGPEGLSRDIGNIIFNHEAVCGVKRFKESELNRQGQYWYDEGRHLLKLYSEKSPAEYYSDIECAVRHHIIDQSNASYVIYGSLALKYGAAHGIGGHNTHHITARNCDISYIGGGDLAGGERTVRFGNGIEYWSNAHDNLVENCRLWEIYDAALTNQSHGQPCQQYNLVYRNNVIWNCEYSFEYWNRPKESLTYNVVFENNTCFNAGGGWGHGQRPDPNGRHLCFYISPAQARDIHIRNNIFHQCTNNAFYLDRWPEAAVRGLDMRGNCWHQPEGDMVRLIGLNGGEKYPMGQFAAFKAKCQPKDDSIAADPKMVDPARGDYRLRPDSPCPKAGATPLNGK